MKNKFIIAVDSGKSTNKAVMREEGELHRVKFQTKVEEVSNLGTELTHGSYMVEFEGKSFLVGDMLDESKMDFSLSKKSETHRICIYIAIAQLLQKSKQNVVLANISLAVNIPLSQYKNELQKMAFNDYIRSNGETICIIINKISFLFRIDSVLLLPEGIGPIYTDIARFKQQKTVIFDIGSLNVNIQEYNKLVPSFDKMLTADLGVNILRARISDTLTSHYGISISDNDVEAIYRDKYLILNGEKQEESKDIVERLTTNHVKEIFNFTRSRKISFNNMEILFVGGGSLLLRDYILSEQPSAVISAEPQWANVLSFLRSLRLNNMDKRRISISFKKEHQYVYNHLQGISNRSDYISNALIAYMSGGKHLPIPQEEIRNIVLDILKEQSILIQPFIQPIPPTNDQISEEDAELISQLF